MTLASSRALLLLMAGCASACSAPGPQAAGTGPAERPAERALRPSGAAPVELGRIVSRARASFRSTRQGLSAEGAAHRIDVEGGAARIRAKPSARAARRGRARQLQALAGARSAAELTARRRALRGPLLEGAPGELQPGSALTLTTRSIARAGHECVNGEGRVRMAADGGAERAFETCSELWKNHEANAEQAFRFPERPGGRGDLVVRVSARLGAADAAPSVASDARGLVLGAAPGQRFVYGHGTWIDASGRRVPVPARWADGHIELRVPASVVEESGYPALLDPEVGPEIGTEPPVPVQQDVGFDPEIATDGTSYVVVFEDLSRIRAVRVGARGDVLDLDWLDLGEESAGQYLPSVAYGGGRYLVTWSQYGDDARITIRGRVMRPDGTLEGPASFAISTSAEGVYPSVEWNGERFVTAWLSLADDGADDVRATLVDPSGSAVPGAERALSTSGRASRPAVGAGADVSVVAWDEDVAGGGARAIRAARVASDGTALDAFGVQISEDPGNARLAALASGATSFLATWVRDDPTSTIRGAVLRADGTIAARDFPISRPSPGAGAPAAAFDGSSYLVAWADERDGRAMYGARVSAEGVVQGTDDVRLADGSPRSVRDSDRNALVWNGSHFLLAFHGQGIEGSLIGPDLALAAGRLGLSPLPNRQGAPRVAWTGESYLVAWTDEPDPEGERTTARAVRVSAAGEVVDPVGIELASSAFAIDLASNGGGASVLTWSALGAGGDHLRRVSGDGALGESVAVSSLHLSATPSVAGNGDGYLVTFVERTAEEPFVYTASGRLLGASGSAGPVFPIVPSVGAESHAMPLRAGQDYLVAYSKAGLHLVPVSRTGDVGEGFLLSSASAAIAGATDGTDTLVVWTESADGWPEGGDGPVHGRIYGTGGWRSEAFLISPTSAGHAAAVAWDGASYQVVWEEAETHRLRIRAVAPDGTPGMEALLVDDACNAPMLARGEDGRFLLSYDKLGPAARTRRVVSRLLSWEPSPGLAAGGGAGGSGGAGLGTDGGGTVGPGAGGNGGAEPAAGGSGGAEPGAGGSGGTEPGAGGRAGNGAGGGTSSAAAGSSRMDGTDDTGDDAQCSFHGAGSRSAYLGLTVALFGIALVARRRGARSGAMTSGS
ncbi:hypothetical protein WME73_05625 [Sorangium sp. So ce302]|uniref:hypothetical protein n=1 Tax=Sorangium sp. So ce302 TaxID=3133297 RepID=UPI003F6125A2